MGRTPAQQSSDLQALVAKISALQGPASSISTQASIQSLTADESVVNGPLLLVGLGPYPQIITGIADIVSTATSQISSSQGSQPITDEKDGKQLLADFTILTLVTQQLLNVLIGKAGLFNSVPFIGEPVAAALRSFESVLDTVAFSLVDQCEGNGDIAKQLSAQQNSLDQTLAAAIQAHVGIQT